MTSKIRTVRLYGTLGTKFGREFRLAVKNPAEAVQALCAMVPGFQAELAQSKDRGVGYSIFVGKRNLAVEQLGDPPGDGDIRIAPMLLGSKNGGIFQIVLGIALIAISVMLPGSGVGLMAAFSSGGFTGALAMFGASMVIGGVVQLLTPIPKGIAGEANDSNASYIFNGAVNTQAQGHPVPLCYGRSIVGSAVISAGIGIEDTGVSSSRSGERIGGGKYKSEPDDVLE